MDKITELISNIKEIVCIPLIILLFIVGVLFTIKLRGLQIRKLPNALKFMVKNEEEGAGEVSSFGALCITLSATIGTGSIIGVATAINEGGPGALFWMLIMGILGMATKYAEGFLAIKYRKVNEDGTTNGGPFAYIEFGMGEKWKWLAILFAIFGAFAGIVGIGTTTQITGITSSFDYLLENTNPATINLLGNNVTIISIVIGSIVTVLTALVLLGGLKRIEGVCSIIVPFMAIAYVLICLLMIVINIKEVPAAIKEIVVCAFDTKAIAGGFAGSILMVIQTGVARGIFSNESGLGSIPIASSTAKTKDPVRQGLVSMTGTFIALIICFMTGIAIVIGKTWMPSLGYEGITITTVAFQNDLPFNDIVAKLIITIAISFFAFTTIVGWNVYGVRCIHYLTNYNKKVSTIYKILWLVVIFIGPYLALDFIWKTADIANTLMAVPNLIALIALNKVVSKDTLEYFEKLKHVEE